MSRMRKPTELKLLAGNPGKRPLPENEPKPEPISGVPKPPPHLKKHARKAWLTLCERFIGTRILTDDDLLMLEGICIYRQKFIEFARRGEVMGPGDMTQYRLLMENFGMSPASRSKVKVIGKKDDKEAALFGVA